MAEKTKRQLFEEPLFKKEVARFSELGMWLMAMDKFFITDNLPMSDEMRSRIASKNFLEEVKVIKAVTVRVRILLSDILGEEKSSLLRFLNYIEHNLLRHTEIGSLNRKLFSWDFLTESFNAVLESMNDIGVITTDLARLSEVSYTTFDAVGSIMNREIFRNEGIKPLIDHSFVPEYDRVKNPVIANIVKGIGNRKLRLGVAQVFLELFRLLRYLEYVDTDIEGEGDPRKYSMALFTLINSESKALSRHVNTEVIGGIEEHGELADILDATIFSMNMELKKVYKIELIDLLSMEEPDLIYARLENSKGILKECFQQSIVQIARFFKKNLHGTDIFRDYITKLQQTKKLLVSLEKLVAAVQNFREGEAEVESLVQEAMNFKETSLKYLMYKDWHTFEDFVERIVSTTDDDKLEIILSDYDAYLEALLKEVNKRSVLREEGS